jgi:hypothetical protein
MLHPKLEKNKTPHNGVEKKLEFDSKNYNNYTLKYLYNTNNTFFKLFMHIKVYDKITNENIEKKGILLRNWNPITKYGERYVFNKEDGEGDLNTKTIYLPDAKTIIELTNTNENEEILKLAKEIINICPHKDIQIKYID